MQLTFRVPQGIAGMYVQELLTGQTTFEQLGSGELSDLSCAQKYVRLARGRETLSGQALAGLARIPQVVAA